MDLENRAEAEEKRADEEIFLGLANFKDSDGKLYGQGLADWEYIHKKYEPYVYNFIIYNRFPNILKEGGEIQEIEDIVQDTFLDLFRAIGKFKGESKLKTYLSSIALNRLRRRIRKQATKKRGECTEKIPFEDIGEESEDISYYKPDPLEIYVAKSNQQTLADILKETQMELTPDLRHVLELRFFKDLKYEEIAEEMKIPPGSVGRLINMAIFDLKFSFNSMGISYEDFVTV